MTSKQWLKWDEECSDLGVAASALHACIADLAACEEERDDWKINCEAHQRYRMDNLERGLVVVSRCKELEERMVRMRKALEYYADYAIYVHGDDGVSHVEIDRGNVTRAALRKGGA